MVPAKASDGTIRYEVFTIRLFLDIGEKQRPGCWAIPMVHEKILMYLYDAKLVSTDFVGQRLELLGKNVFDVAIKATTKGYYAGYEIVTESTPPITPQNDPISATMSSQCK